MFQARFLCLVIAQIFSGNTIGCSQTTLVALLTSAWAMHLLVDANLWARRSQLMAANVELEFFTSADMEVLLPRSYYGEGRRYRYRRVFRVGMLLSLAFFFTCLILLPLTLNLKSLTTLLIAVLLLCSVHLENRKCAQEFAYLVEHAAGRIRVDAQ